MKPNYIGEWIGLQDLNREVKAGDWVKNETLDDVIVVKISKIIKMNLALQQLENSKVSNCCYKKITNNIFPYYFRI